MHILFIHHMPRRINALFNSLRDIINPSNSSSGKSSNKSKPYTCASSNQVCLKNGPSKYHFPTTPRLARHIKRAYVPCIGDFIFSNRAQGRCFVKTHKKTFSIHKGFIPRILPLNTYQQLTKIMKIVCELLSLPTLSRLFLPTFQNQKSHTSFVHNQAKNQHYYLKFNDS